MVRRCLICSCVAIFVVCSADKLSDMSSFREMMNNQELKELPSNVLESNDPGLPFYHPGELYEILKQINFMDDPVDLQRSIETETVNKRPFCNGFTGCGRFGKRRLHLMRQRFPMKVFESQVKKRPFCNGFFGCGNGKRSEETDIIESELNSPVNSGPQKRLFCNSMTGCSNAGKRYSTLLNRLHESTNDQDVPLPFDVGNV